MVWEPVGTQQAYTHLFPFLNSASRYRMPSRAPGCSFFSKSRPSITGGQGGAGKDRTGSSDCGGRGSAGDLRSPSPAGREGRCLPQGARSFHSDLPATCWAVSQVLSFPEMCHVSPTILSRGLSEAQQTVVPFHG